jgi:dihydrodipicolinate synthase/N-acetylneuraminate lyase
MNPYVAKLLSDPIGAYPSATVAAFDPTCGELPRRRLDEGRNIAFLERLSAEGAEAALIASSTGQGHLRTVEELESWLECSAQASLGSTVKMALLRPEDGYEANCRLLERLVEWGYPIVFFRPGADLPATARDEQVADSLSPLVAQAARLGLAVGLYSIPDVSGVRLTPEAAARIVGGPSGEHIAAIKVTEADYKQSTLRFLRHPALSRLKIVQGWDPFLARALADGPKHDPHGRQRCGVTSGPMSFALYQYQHILKAAAAGDAAEVAEAQAAVTALFVSMQDDPKRFADLQRAKYIMGLGHPITAAISQEQAERVLTALEGLPRQGDRRRLARSLDLMGDSPLHERLQNI